MHLVPDGYTVTIDGRVKGRRGNWLKPTIIHGQPSVCFQVDGTQRRVYVGRLVCEVFHGPPPTSDYVAEHIDGDSGNNHADNLKWSTRCDVGRRQAGEEKPHIQGELHPQAVLTWEEVQSIRQEFARGSVTKAHLGRQHNVTESAIHLVITNHNWCDPTYVPPTGERDNSPR